MRFLGGVLVVAMFALVAVMLQPAHLIHVSGTRPVVDSYDRACPGDEHGVENCWTDTAFRWRLSAGGARAATTLGFDRDDITSLTGVVELGGSGCQESRVEWELETDQRTVGGVLSAGSRSAKVDFTAPLSRVLVSVRRTDTASCASEFRLTEPDLEFPAFSLP